MPQRLRDVIVVRLLALLIVVPNSKMRGSQRRKNVLFFPSPTYILSHSSSIKKHAPMRMHHLPDTMIQPSEKALDSFIGLFLLDFLGPGSLLQGFLRLFLCCFLHHRQRFTHLNYGHPSSFLSNCPGKCLTCPLDHSLFVDNLKVSLNNLP